MVRRNNFRCRAKNLQPRQEGVVTLYYHQGNKHQKAQWRKYDGEDQRQPFPCHVHENGDNKSCLQKHEQQNQGPSKWAFELKIVHRIGKCAQYEQQNPDSDINPQGVLLVSFYRGYC